MDADPEVGGGHAVRTQATALALAGRGFQPRIFARRPLEVPDDPWKSPKGEGGRSHAALPGPFPVEPLGSDAASTCASLGAALAVVDLPHTRPPGADALRALRQSGALLVTFDSTDPTAAESDVLVHLVALPGELPEARPSARLLLGPRYAVLRPTLADAARRDEIRSSRNARVSEDRARLLVAFGASDPVGLTPRLLEALVRRPLPIDLAVLVGPMVNREAARHIERLAAELPACRAHQAVPDPLDLLAWADLAVVGFGLLFLEALATGLPTVLWHPSPAHEAVAARFRRHLADEVSIDVGDSTVSPDVVVGEIARLAGDAALRVRLGAAAAQAVDGQGAERVAMTLSEMVSP